MSRHHRRGKAPANTKRGPSAAHLFYQMHLPVALRAEFYFLLWTITRSGILRVISRLFPVGTLEYVYIEHAYEVAVKVLTGRRHTGERELMHTLRCVLVLILHLGCKDADMICAMLLHDVTEKKRNRWPIERIAREFNPRVARFVAGLTKPAQRGALRSPKAVDRAFFAEFKDAEELVVMLKAVDRFDNHLTIWTHSPKKKRAKIRETKENILPEMRKYGIMVREMEAVLAYNEANGN